MSDYKLIVGDGPSVMGHMETCSFLLIVTSPPYDDIRSYGGHAWNFQAMAKQMARVIVQGGIICWVINDSVKNGSESLTSARQKIYFVEECGLRCRTLIYQKNNFSHPNSSWYHSVFEYVFVFSKGKPRVWNPIMDRKNIYAGQVGSKGENTATQQDGSKVIRPRKVNTQYGKRHNIWKGPTRSQEDMCQKQTHPALMPRWLARDLILSFSNEGDTVLDPMCGEFTVGIEALKLKRRACGIDIHQPYIRTAESEVLQLLKKAA